MDKEKFQTLAEIDEQINAEKMQAGATLEQIKIDQKKQEELDSIERIKSLSTSELESEQSLKVALSKEVDDEVKAEKLIKRLEMIREALARENISPEQKSMESGREKQWTSEKIAENSVPLFNAVREALKEPSSEPKSKVKDGKTPENITFENFEKINIDGKEMMISKEIFKAVSYADAVKLCELANGKLPSIKEYEYMFNNLEISSKSKFDRLTFWSRDEYSGDVRVFNFKTGQEEIRNKEQSLETAIAIADIH